MSDFLRRLAERTLGLASPVQPVLASRFEPGQPIAAALQSSDVPEVAVEAERGTIANRGFPGPDSPARMGAEPRVASHAEWGTHADEPSATRPGAVPEPRLASAESDDVVGADPQRPARAGPVLAPATAPEASSRRQVHPGDPGAVARSREQPQPPAAGAIPAAPNPAPPSAPDDRVASEANESPRPRADDQLVPAPVPSMPLDLPSAPRSGPWGPAEQPIDPLAAQSGLASLAAERTTAGTERGGDEWGTSTEPTGPAVDRAAPTTDRVDRAADRRGASPKATALQPAVPRPIDGSDDGSASRSRAAVPGGEGARRDTRSDGVAVAQPAGPGLVQPASATSRTMPPARPSPAVTPATLDRAGVTAAPGPATPPISGVRSEAAPAARPTVQVTIGRIEVRAVPPPPASPARREPAGPRVSLDDYLRERNGGRP